VDWQGNGSITVIQQNVAWSGVPVPTETLTLSNWIVQPSPLGAGSVLSWMTTRPAVVQKTWSIVQSAPGVNNGNLLGVATVSPTEAWAVGLQSDGGAEAQPLIEHFINGLWQTVPANDSNIRDILYSVAVVSASDIWAVGRSWGQPLIEHWNGNSWSVFPGDPTVYVGWLNKAIVISASNVWAVGGDDGTAFSEHWDGSSWTAFYGDAGEFYDVKAFSHVWAMGNNSGGGTLLEEWTGSGWTALPVPLVGGQDTPKGIAGFSDSNFYLAGMQYSQTTQLGQDYVQHWNGKSWTVSSTPPSFNNVSFNSGAYAIAADSRSDIWTVGWSQLPNSSVQPFMYHWEGQVWSAFIAPSVQNNEGSLSDITFASDHTGWAVGGQSNSTTSRPLIERYA
jgi:hypothetical protein